MSAWSSCYELVWFITDGSVAGHGRCKHQQAKGHDEVAVTNSTYERDQMLAVNRWACGAVVSKWILTRAKRVLHPFIPPKSSPSSLLAKQILAWIFLRQASHVMQELREMARWLCKDVRWWPRATPMR